MNFKSLKDQFIQEMANVVPCSVDDLALSELAIINKAYDIFLAKLDEIKVLNDENKRITIELLNLKSSRD